MAKLELSQMISKLGADLPHPILEQVCERLEELESFDAVHRLLGAVSGRWTRERLRMLAEMARDHAVPPVALAWALRSAATTDAAHRSRSLEIVWTGPTPHGTTLRRTDQALLEMISAAQRSILIVTFAAYRVDAIRAALLAAAARNVSIQFIVENPDVSRGKVKFDPILAFGPELAEHAQAYVWPLERRAKEDGRHGTLHAKCAIVDTERILISSANFTGDAMNLNMELGMLMEGPVAAEVEAHFESLILKGVLVPLEDAKSS